MSCPVFSLLLLSGSPCWDLVASSQAALAGLLGTNPSHSQQNFLGFLGRAVEQTPLNGPRFSLWSWFVLACFAVYFKGSLEGLAVLGGDQGFSIRGLGQCH